MALPWITGLGIQAGGGQAQDTVGLAFPHPTPSSLACTTPRGLRAAGELLAHVFGP